MNVTPDKIYETINVVESALAKLEEQLRPILGGREVIEANLHDGLFPNNKEWASRGVEDRVVMLTEEYLILKDKLAELEANQPAQWPHDSTVRIRWAGDNLGHRVSDGWAKRDDQGNLVSAYSLLPLDPSCWEVIEERTA